MKLSSASSHVDTDSDCSCPSSPDIKIAGGKVDRSKRLKASARERRRRHVLNDALENLRSKVAQTTRRSNHKLSKIEVLRLAIDYISMLSCYLDYTPTFPQQHPGYTQCQPMENDVCSPTIPYDTSFNQHQQGMFDRLNREHLEQQMRNYQQQQMSPPMIEYQTMPCPPQFPTDYAYYAQTNMIGL